MNPDSKEAMKEKPIVKTLWLIRHAESTHNAKAADDPDENYFNCGLTEKGRKQANAVQGPTELLLCSPLRRTLETYSHSQLKVKKFETVEELREWTTWGPSCMYDLENPNKRESVHDFRNRVAKAIQIIKRRPEAGITLLSHGATLAEMCRQLKLPCETGWYNAEVRQFRDVVFP
jgi:broad specificity phosphatase PhoE